MRRPTVFGSTSRQLRGEAKLGPLRTSAVSTCSIIMGDAELVRTASAGISGQENLETVIELFRDRALVASESGDHLIALEMHDVADAAERLHWGISIAENY